MNLAEKMTEADLFEWILVTNGIIHAFETRGWALYPVGKGPMMFSCTSQVMEIVSFGREGDAMEIGVRYMLLPLIEDSKDTFQMQKAIEEVCRRLGGPYYADLEDSKDGTEILGRHLIDSTSVEPPNLELHLDVKFQQVMTENTVMLPLATAANTICKQMLMSLRGPKVKK